MSSLVGHITIKPIPFQKENLDIIHEDILELIEEVLVQLNDLPQSQDKWENILKPLKYVFCKSQMLVELTVQSGSQRELHHLKRKLIQNFSCMNDFIHLIGPLLHCSDLPNTIQQNLRKLINYQQAEEHQVYNFLATVESDLTISG